jgi:hypothetical protein
VALLLTRQGRVQLARSLYSDVFNSDSYYHFALGRTTPAWNDDSLPPNPLDSEYTIKEFRNDIMFVKRLASTDVCHLARRIDWVSGTVYDPYDDTYSASNPAYSEATNLADSNFYVITDEFKVYKCLDNNSDSPSTVKPTKTTNDPEQESDGYIWKFLFQVTSGDQTKFLDSNYIPVRKLSGNPDFDVNGEVDSISVTNRGSDYTTASVDITGDGSGATATANIVAGEIDSITPTNFGSGYTFAFANITGDGTNAEATVLLGDTEASSTLLQSAVEGAAIPGTIDRIVVTNPGQDYVSGDIVITITGDGSGAEATATVSATTGAVTGITVTSAGTGYTWVEITIGNTFGVGTSATARAILSPINGHGSNPVEELFGSTIALVTSLADDSNTDFILGNDFRQIGLIKNIKNYAETAVFTETSGTATFIIDVDDSSDYNVDDEITTDTGGLFKVAQKTDDGSGTYQVHLIPEIGNITNSSVLTNTTTGASALSINSVTSPEVSVHTGNVMYLENRTPISRQVDQVETIKALIKF